MSIESVAEELRVLRRRIEAQTTNPHSWPTKEEELDADLDRYDRRLLKASTMLRVAVPTGTGREGALLSEAERSRLEQVLSEAGLDLGNQVGKSQT